MKGLWVMFLLLLSVISLFISFGERSRDWSLGHAGDEGPHLSMTGESRGCSRAAAPVCGFSRGMLESPKDQGRGHPVQEAMSPNH